MGRQEKYSDRKRYIYALLFDNGCCYIGQSVNPKTRNQGHKNVTGGWGGQPFTMVVLGEMHGTRADAEDWEYAYRYKAHKAGWDIYGLPPNIIVSATKRMTFKRYAIAAKLRWPRQHNKNRLIDRFKPLLYIGAGLLLLRVSVFLFQ